MTDDDQAFVACALVLAEHGYSIRPSDGGYRVIRDSDKSLVGLPDEDKTRTTLTLDEVVGFVRTMDPESGPVAAG